MDVNIMFVYEWYVYDMLYIMSSSPICTSLIVYYTMHTRQTLEETHELLARYKYSPYSICDSINAANYELHILPCGLINSLIKNFMYN